MTTLLQELEVRQTKLAEAIRLLREIGMGDMIGGTSIMASQAPTKTGRTVSADAKKRIGDKMRLRWAEKRAQGVLMNPNQTPKKPLIPETNEQPVVPKKATK